MRVSLVHCLAVVALMALLPSLAHAQSSITGTIRDASGAVLPGVTVEVASPVLIEKVRSTVSDGSGQYRLTELLPGTYSLTFSLPGFSTVKRDGVEITGAGVMTINQDLKVGELQETITVTGETPIVDVQSTRRQQVITDETLNALPATRGYNALVFLVPSVTGGSNQIDLMPAMRIFYSHGGRGNEGRTYVDGLSTGSAFNGGGASGYIIDTSNSQEMQLTLSGGLGETEMGGTSVNFIPKTGGNTFSGQGFFSTAGEWSQGNNIDDRLRAIGLSQAAALYKNWDVQGSLGGPIFRDKLWFFGNYRDFGSHDDILGMYGNLNAGNANAWNYVPDQNLKARNAVSRTVTAVRLTAQVTPRNKIGFFFDNQLACDGSAMITTSDDCRPRGEDWVASGTTSITPEAASGAQGTAGGAFGYADSWQRVMQATWSAPVTSRLLLEAGASTYISKWGWMEQPGAILNLNQVQEQAAQIGAFADGTPWSMPANLTYRALDWNFNNMQNPTTWRAAASYVTGAHSMKIGYVAAYNRTDSLNHYNASRLNYRFLSGVPNQLTMQLGDFFTADRSQYHALYVQDQWTVNRLTLQGALRYDRAWSWSPEGQGADGYGQVPAGPDLIPGNGWRARLQRHLAAHGRCLRCLRQREDVAEGQPRSLSPAGKQPGSVHADESRGRDSLCAHDQPHLERSRRTWRQRGLRSAVRHDEPCGQWGMRSVAAAGVRTGALGGADQPGDPRGLGRATVRLAVRCVGPARDSAANLAGGWLSPPLVPGFPGDRQSGVDAGRLRAVHLHGADASVAPGRWWL